MKSSEIISHAGYISWPTTTPLRKCPKPQAGRANFAENAWQTLTDVFILLKKGKIILRKRHIKRATGISYNTIRANNG
jgi:hypothetical protein